MAKTVKKIGKNTLILLAIIVIAFMGYIIYKAYGPKIMELIMLLEHGNQDELTAYLAAQSTFGGFVVLWLICVLQVMTVVFPSMVEKLYCLLDRICEWKHDCFLVGAYV